MAASSGHGQEGDETSFDACILILESWNTWGSGVRLGVRTFAFWAT